MKTEEFRKQGYKVIDWIADYYEHIEKYPVLSQVEPGKIRSQLPDNAPIKGREYDDILEDMNICPTVAISCFFSLLGWHPQPSDALWPCCM